MVENIRELTEEDFARAIPRKQRERIMSGRIEPGKDIAALRRFVGLTQEEFVEALGISVHTLRNWEQGRRKSRRSGSRFATHCRPAPAGVTGKPRRSGINGFAGTEDRATGSFAAHGLSCWKHQGFVQQADPFQNRSCGPKHAAIRPKGACGANCPETRSLGISSIAGKTSFC